ncbi:hypothetical protein MMC30_002136 [Trapelia coarctata]|nr:hypothetical protein [Trapelia coarctata]
MAEKSIPDVGDFATSPIITISVGTRPPVQFFLHKELLTSKCRTFFAPALKGKPMDAQKPKIDLPEIDPNAFSLFVKWLYTGSVPAIPYQEKWGAASFDGQIVMGIVDSEINYHKLYYMAEKFCIYALTDTSVDCIREFHDATRTSVHPKLVLTGYQNTRHGSPLRTYLCRCVAFSLQAYTDIPRQLGSVIKDEPDIMADVLNYCQSKACFEEIEDPDIDRVHNFHVLSTEPSPLKRKLKECRLR